MFTVYLNSSHHSGVCVNEDKTIFVAQENGILIGGSDILTRGNFADLKTYNIILDPLNRAQTDKYRKW